MPIAPALGGAAEAAWLGQGLGARALRAALAPAAFAYGAGVALRNRLYDRGWLRVERVPARVVSVGNLAVGGTGKTPVTLWLAEALAARGRRVAIVARGYGKRRRGVVVVSDGRGPLVTAEEGGDEAVMLARRFPGPVLTGERRVEAARAACTRFGCDTLVLDDGFQHRALARDADLVLLGPEGTAARLLPAGPLREPPAALARARALLVVGPTPRPEVAAFHGRIEPRSLVGAAGGTWTEEPLARLAGCPVIVATGVARPARVAATLEAVGARVLRILAFPDHHVYDHRDAARLAAATAEALVVTTEKDLVKLDHLPGLDAVRALRVALVVDEEERLVDRLLVP